MSLTIKHLNTDASFLLTFQPILPFPPTPGQSRNFTIVIDPWLSGPSNIIHPFFSSTKNKEASCISSLTELPEPNLIIISQSMPDHCHKSTLTTLPKHGGKFLILAEPSAAKLIRSWKHFDPSQVLTLKEWTKPKNNTSSTNIHHISLPPLTTQGSPGEITITLLKEGDASGLKNAIAITYLPPTSGIDLDLDLLTPPSSPFSPTHPNSSTTSIQHPTSNSPQTLSLLHIPHGISLPTLLPFLTSHHPPPNTNTNTNPFLPLTALLHCFDTIQNPKWLGGNICTGAPSGIPIAERLQAKLWISAHDGDKEVKGVANKKLRIRRWERGEIAERVSPRVGTFGGRDGDGNGDGTGGTEVLVLGAGEERVVGLGGLWAERMGGSGSGIGRGVGALSPGSWDMGIGDGDETEVEMESESVGIGNGNVKFHAS
ncbi:hypothetical protein EG329_010601 [Mollisiaceae sp. DMI_Dod_QoI]|nr:hypothetical protein EG329_010601 [Helotiales sp. DMI_Dod_QoI]